MPKRSSIDSRNFTTTLRQVGDKAVIRQPLGTDLEGVLSGKNPAAVALGRLGGIKGGKARAEKLSKEERHRIAVLAAKSRWHGK